jgi:hypothetical protein
LHGFDNIFINIYGSWSENNDEQGREYKKYEREKHFYRQFGGNFLGSLLAFDTKGIGIYPEGIRHAGPEFIGLDEERGQTVNLVKVCPQRKISEGLIALLAGA